MGVLKSFDGWIRDSGKGPLVALFAPAAGASEECLRPAEKKFGLGVDSLLQFTAPGAAGWDSTDQAEMKKALGSYDEVRQHFVESTDERALASVARNIGGPFGARMVIFCDDGRIVPVGKYVGNAVVSSGVASRHAEHEDWTQNFDDLHTKLGELKNVPKTLVQFSSGESCINCHAKQEAGVRALIAEGLLEPTDKFEVVYGATYRQTADVAKFNDLVYLLALQKNLGMPLNGGEHNTVLESDIAIAGQLAGQLKHRKQKIELVPPEVAEIFKCAESPVAVLVRAGKVYATGHDKRTEHFTLTPEVSVMQEACKRNRQEGIFESWDLGGATLYTSTAELGPLMVAEGFWSNTLDFVTVEHPRQAEWATQEAPNITNGELLKLVAQRPYGQNAAGLASVSYLPSKNIAQIF